jgi:hypothetical protein
MMAGRCSCRTWDDGDGVLSVRGTYSDGGESVQWQDAGRGRRCAVGTLKVCSDGGQSVQLEDAGRGWRCVVGTQYSQ